jgi:tetratricopeptide (TPR) repeat protein
MGFGSHLRGAFSVAASRGERSLSRPMMRRASRAIGALLLSAACACGGVRETTRNIEWKAPPSGPPGSQARVDDQSEPRLEALGTAPPPAGNAAADAMQRADALSRERGTRAAGDLPDAIALQSQSVTVRTNALGADSPDVAAAQTNLAGLYAAADRYDEAEPLLRRALAIREKAYGANGRLTALSRNNLALLLAADGRSAEAELLYLQAIAVLEHDDPKEFATVLENYAALLDDTGRHEEAKAMEQRAAVVRVSIKK